MKKETSQEQRDRKLRQWFRLPIKQAVLRQAARHARLLNEIAGDMIQFDMPSGEAVECADNKLRRPTDAEAHNTLIWFHDNFYLDCRRPDFLAHTAAQLRKGVAELSKIADRIEAAAKRRKGARS
jgi:hypothetical protein